MFTGSPTDFGTLIAEDAEKWAKVIKFANIKLVNWRPPKSDNAQLGDSRSPCRCSRTKTASGAVAVGVVLMDAANGTCRTPDHCNGGHGAVGEQKHLEYQNGGLTDVIGIRDAARERTLICSDNK